MKGVQIVEPNKLQIVDLEKPQIDKENNVLVRMVAAGICGSDVGIYHGTNAAATYPRIIGHENVGIVEEIGEGVEWNHNQAFDPLGLGYDTTLDSTGIHKLRSGPDKEDHMYNPRTILLLQKAAREGDYQAFKAYTALVDTPDKPHTLRGLLDLRYDENGGIPIEEVEPVESIVSRLAP